MKYSMSKYDYIPINSLIIISSYVIVLTYIYITIHFFLPRNKKLLF